MSAPIRIGRGVPAWVLRAVVLAACVTIVLLTMDGAPVLGLGLIAVVGLLAVVLPASPAPALLIVTTAIVVATGDGGPLRAEVLVLLPVTHLVHVCCALAAVVPVTARVHPSAFRAPALRFLVIQAGVLALAVVAGLASTGATPAPLEVIALIGVALLAPLAIRLLRKPTQVTSEQGPGPGGNRPVRL
jgi:hypothetical protein